MNLSEKNTRSRGLGTLILGPTKSYTDYLYREFATRRDLDVFKVIDEYPTLHYLVRLINSYEPELVFVEIGAGDSGFKVARDIQAAAQATSIIGFGDDFSAQQRDRAVEIGITDLLRIPFTEESLKKAVGKALKSESQGSHQNVQAFLPAKAGSGATTAALNTAVALARSWGQKVLLIDADLHSGSLPVLLKLDPEQSIVDALEMSDSLDEARWKGLITKAEGIDLLPTPWGKPAARFTPWEYHRLLAFASPRYDHVIVDLPEVVNDATEAIVTRASCVHIVSTSESSSVFLARRRMHELETRSVRPDHVRVILNRSAEQGAVTEIELLLGRKLFWILPNDYVQVRAATSAGRAVESDSKLGKAYRLFAADIASIEVPPDEPGESGDAAPPESDSSSVMDKLRKTLDRFRGDDVVKRPT